MTQPGQPALHRVQALHNRLQPRSPITACLSSSSTSVTHHTMAPSEKDRRAAALAAAEARLKGSPSPAELEEAARTPKAEQWKQPSEKDDIEAKRVLARLIDRGIVRDNGYRQSADAVEVSFRLAVAGSAMVDGSSDARADGRPCSRSRTTSCRTRRRSLGSSRARTRC